MDLSKLTQVTRYEITDNGFIFYDENGNVPDPSNAYWDGALNLYTYKGKSLKGLPSIVHGSLWLDGYQGKSLKGLPSVVSGYLHLNNYKGNDFNNLSKEYRHIFIKGKWYKKSEFDDMRKTEKLKEALLD